MGPPALIALIGVDVIMAALESMADVQRAAGLVVLVDGQRNGQGAEVTGLDRAGQAVRPPAIGAGVGDFGQLTGASGVQAGAVAALAAPGG